MKQLAKSKKAISYMRNSTVAQKNRMIQIASCHWALTVKATFHLTISMGGQLATGKIQRDNCHHGSCGPSLTGRTMSVFLILTQGTHRNAKNR